LVSVDQYNISGNGGSGTRGSILVVVLAILAILAITLESYSVRSSAVTETVTDTETAEMS